MSPSRIDFAGRLAVVTLPDVEWLTIGALADLLEVSYVSVPPAVERGDLPKPRRRTNQLPSHQADRVATVDDVKTLGRCIATLVFNVAELAEWQARRPEEP